MQIVSLVCFCSITAQLLGVGAFSLLSMYCELVIVMAILISRSEAIRGIQSWRLRLGASDKGIWEVILQRRHDYLSMMSTLYYKVCVDADEESGGG